eukprot:131675-Pleurochrysis_carterae.AAC.1
MNCAKRLRLQMPLTFLATALSTTLKPKTVVLILRQRLVAIQLLSAQFKVSTRSPLAHVRVRD